ncbi:MAG TPA: response regulator transcription factor [Spirochaetia bacterium]|nr:response regulator transcription factor [Spirochaetia bacterium]
MAMRVLVVDDDPNVCEVARLYLEKQRAEVISVLNGTDALEYLQNSGADLIILDLMMPGIDGLTMCREIRKGSTVPIIMLTAKASEYDRILGLDMGADDYITKPFSPSELVSRVNSLMRRIEFDTNRYNHEKLEFTGLIIDVTSRSLLVCGENIKVTPKEFDLLYLLAKEPGRVFSRNKIMDVIWGYDRYVNDRTVDVHIKWLREKLRHNNNECSYLHTIHKVGYKFEVHS